MKRTMLKSKIHRASVTDSNVDYVGSIEVDRELMEAADIIDNEQVHVWNVTRGERFVTYAVPANRSSGTICINGAAAHRAGPDDQVIIASFAELQEEEARAWEPRIVFVDAENRIIEKQKQAAG